MANKFGGIWTVQKMDFVVKYAKAYLTVMKDRTYWGLIYFDGFAGSGTLQIGQEGEEYNGISLQILSIDEPRRFDIYYLVEKNSARKRELETAIKTLSLPPSVRTYTQVADCNQKVRDLADFLDKEKREGRTNKVLAVLDPFGAQLDWDSINVLEGHSVDLALLIPVSGVNRMITRDGKNPESWDTKLERFFGLPIDEIKEAFYYRDESQQALFDDVASPQSKTPDGITLVGELYKKRLNTIFKHVTRPMVLRNSKGHTLFHLVLATNNSTAKKIAQDIIDGGKQH